MAQQEAPAEIGSGVALEPDEVQARGEASSTAVVAVPEQPQRERLGFWQRLSLPLRRRDAQGDARILERLEAIESHIATAERSVVERLDQLEQRFSEVWEVEEALSHLMEIQGLLGQIRDHESKTDASLAKLRRRVGWLAALAVLAIAGGLAGVVLL